ncbi:MAG: DMT family transporter [Flavobacteriales bacterium]|nr:DMT family transporter [Flavobacteriales bacterium]
MIYLALSILFSTSLLVIFKFFEKHGINNTVGIIVNYITAASTGFIMSGKAPDISLIAGSEWSPFAMLIGTIFVSLFFTIAISAQKNGMAITSVANKMSLVIPTIAAVFLYQESLQFLTIVGIVLALTGVVFTALKSDQNNHLNRSAFLFPAIIFLGSGISDTLLKYVQFYYLHNVTVEYFSAVLFATAGSAGIIIFIFMQFKKRQKIRIKDILGGIALGIPNYFSIHYLFLALDQKGINSSTLIPINNIGIVVASALVGLLFFSEKYSMLNKIGLLLSVLAIVLIALV